MDLHLHFLKNQHFFLRDRLVKMKGKFMRRNYSKFHGVSYKKYWVYRYAVYKRLLLGKMPRCPIKMKLCKLHIWNAEAGREIFCVFCYSPLFNCWVRWISGVFAQLFHQIKRQGGQFDCSAEFHVEMDFRQDIPNYKLKMLPKMLLKILPSFGKAIELAPRYLR